MLATSVSLPHHLCKLLQGKPQAQEYLRTCIQVAALQPPLRRFPGARRAPATKSKDRCASYPLKLDTPTALALNVLLRYFPSQGMTVGWALTHFQDQTETVLNNPAIRADLSQHWSARP